MLKSMRKSKNRYFYHIFVSPGNAPGAITLNVVWMEREYRHPVWYGKTKMVSVPDDTIQYNLLNSSNKRACSNRFVSVTIVSSN